MPRFQHMKLKVTASTKKLKSRYLNVAQERYQVGSFSSVKLSNFHHGFPLKKGDVRPTYSYAVPNSSMNAVFYDYTNDFSVFHVDTHIIRYKYLTVMTLNYKIH